MPNLKPGLPPSAKSSGSSRIFDSSISTASSSKDSLTTGFFTLKFLPDKNVSAALNSFSAVSIIPSSVPRTSLSLS